MFKISRKKLNVKNSPRWLHVSLSQTEPQKRGQKSWAM